jgi:hypothetical protein
MESAVKLELKRAVYLLVFKALQRRPSVAGPPPTKTISTETFVGWGWLLLPVVIT